LDHKNTKEKILGVEEPREGDKDKTVKKKLDPDFQPFISDESDPVSHQNSY